MKRNYSYFIIKPDGMKFFDDICDNIEQKFSSVKYYAIEDYKDIIKKLYYKHYQNKGEKFSKSFESYLYGLTEIFGNQAILAVVANTEMNYEDFVRSVYETKLEIREKYVNDNIGIVTNYGDGEKNYIKLVSEYGEEKSPRIMKELGNHRISDINVIHCPDANIEDTLRELDILSKEGIIDDKNMIMLSMIKQMRKYQTAKFQDDMREPEYEGGIQPDISGFVKNEIQKEKEDYLI